jgi:anti-sigma regulatory factor (Ser/Thr protein kinase)
MEGGDELSTSLRSERGATRDHVVRFYRLESALIGMVGRFVADSQESRAVAIVAATPVHIAAIRSHLEAAGVDPAAAVGRGELIFLDAEELAARIGDGGSVDDAVFEAEIGARVRRAAGLGREVRVFGEIVAVLWDAGHVVAAIELEECWNRLGLQVPFSLLCAYPYGSVTAPEHGSALAEVCALHSHDEVLDGPIEAGAFDFDDEVTEWFRATSPAPSEARHLVCAALEAWGLSAVSDDAALVTTELAANAVVHARSPFEVTAKRGADVVRIEVSDACADDPEPRSASPVAGAGRGLTIVAAVAERWGFRHTRDGKVVWADLRL